jgi:hypothetical protein
VGGTVLPAWLSYNAITRKFSGTPPLNFNGPINLEVYASDGSASAVRQFVISIAPKNDAPTLQGVALPNAQVLEDTSFTYALNVARFSDVDGDTLTFSYSTPNGSALPSWLVFNGTTLTGIPPLNFNGSVAIKVTASDGQSQVSDVFNLVVAPVNDAPALVTSFADTSVNDATSFTLLVPISNFADVDGDTLTLSARLAGGGPLPSWMTLALTANGYALVGTTPNQFSGSYDIDIIASDGSLTASDTLRFTIVNVNDAPTLVTAIADVAFNEDSNISLTLPANTFGDPDGDPLVLSASLANGAPLPSWLSFVGGVFTGTLPTNYNGFIDIRVSAFDGALSVADVFRLTINPVNDAPSLTALIPDFASTEDMLVDITLPLSNFVDVDGDALTFSAKLANGNPLPTWLSFAGGKITGTPPLNFNGSLDIQVSASDGTLTGSDIFRLTINPSNDAPVLVTPLADVTQAATAPVNILIPLASFSDVDGDTLTLSAKLASGAALPSWLSLINGRLVGTPPTGGRAIYDIEVTASDGSLSVSDVLRLTLTGTNQAPVLALALPDRVSNEDTTVSVTLPTSSFTDPNGDALTLSAKLVSGVVLPTWLVFNATTRTFSGTPPLNYNGAIDIRVTASDGTLTAFDDFKLTITAINDAPVLALALVDKTSAEDTPINFILPAGSFTDVDNATLTLSASLADGTPLPTWLAFNAATRAFTGTPPLNFNGFIDVKVTASDGSLTASDEFRLTVTPVNDAPVLVAALADVTSLEDNAVNFTLPAGAFTDVDNASLTWSAKLVSGAILPTWLTFTAATRQFSGTPPLNFNGVLDIRVTASDGTLSAFDDLRVTITPVNDAPVISVALVDIVSAEDVAINFTLPATSFTDVDTATLTLSAALADGTALPAWLAFNPTTRAFTGTPPLNFNGFVDVKVTATDGALSVSDEFRLTISPVNDAPILATALADVTVNEDTAVSFALPAGSFTDVDSATLTLSAKLVSGAVLPSWLIFNATTRQFSGTPPLNFNGVLDVRVTASDGALSAFDDLRITITAVNDAPIVAVALVDVTSAEDAAINFTLPATSFTDVDSTLLTLSASLADGTPLPTWLTFNATTRAFTGTPPLNFSGFVDVKVTANDGTLSVSDEFRLTISPVNDAPIVAALLADQVTIEDSAISFILPAGSFTDVDNASLTLSAKLVSGAVLPSWLTFTAATRQFSGTPPLNFNGVLDIRVTASDGLLSAFDDFKVTITAVNDAPIVAIALTDRSSAEDAAINFILPAGSFTDVDSTLLTLSANLADGTPLPSWLAFNATTRAFTGTPPLNFNGYIDVKVTANDGTLSVSDEFRLTITPVNDAPIGLNDTGLSAVSGNALTISAASLLANDTDVDGNVLTITAVSAAIGGTAVLNGAGQVIYTPTAVYQGIGGFTYTLSDGTVTATAKAFIDVNVAWVYGTQNADVLNGAASLPNRIDGRDGNDSITGGSLNDELLGGLGNDMINGAAGNDTLNGGDGDDVITAGTGNDTVVGGLGADTLVLAGLQASYSIVTSGGSVSVVDNAPTVDGNDGTDIIASIETLRFKGGTTASISSPIILDLDGNGVETLSASDTNARYDLDGDGLTDDTSWFGQTEGMLFLDRDGNGKVTNAGEFSFIDDVPGAKSDLDGLKAFDSNNDGILSALDTRFGEFRIWQDKDSDGVAEASEILTLTAANVKSINLIGTAVNATTKIGDVAVVNKGTYTRTNGTTMDFIDAALTYYSSVTNMPELMIRNQKFDRKASKYTIDFANGEMKVNTGNKSALIDSRSGVLGASNIMTFKKKTFGLFSPIVLDLDGNGLGLTSFKKSRASFDMNGDGAGDNTGWISNGDGFLVIDRNNDGKINHASELSFSTEGTDATSGLGGLAALDSNGDQIIDAKDGRFKELKVWVDANGDGVTDAGELKTLAEIGIKSISLKATNLKGSAKIGQNALLATATFTFTNGLTGTLGNAALAYVPGAKKDEPTPEAASITSNPVDPIVPGSPLTPLVPVAPEEEASLLKSLRAGLGDSSGTLWTSTPTAKNASFFGPNPFEIFAAPEPARDEVAAGLSIGKAGTQGETAEFVPASSENKTFDFPATKDVDPVIPGSETSIKDGPLIPSIALPTSESYTQDLPATKDVEPTVTDAPDDPTAVQDRIVMQMIQDLAAFGGSAGFDNGKLGDRPAGVPRDWFA